jgi:hypothetical protein
MFMTCRIFIHKVYLLFFIKKIQILVTAKSDQDADQGIRMDQHWFGSLDPDPHCHP